MTQLRILSGFRCLLLVLLSLAAAPVASEQLDVRGFVECLNTSGAKYYGAYWCPYCKKQHSMFGREAKYLPYIECSKKGSRKKLSRCSHINGYPTWEFADGRQAGGVQDFSSLSAYTGCKLEPKNYFVD